MTCELKRNLMELLLLYRSQELKEAMRAQMEVQRRLHEQVEVTMNSNSPSSFLEFNGDLSTINNNEIVIH